MAAFPLPAAGYGCVSHIVMEVEFLIAAEEAERHRSISAASGSCKLENKVVFDVSASGVQLLDCYLLHLF